MTYRKVLSIVAGGGVAALLAVPTIGAERMVVGELFTATW